ncbi:MAG: hypothetical protein RDA78_23860 [Roseibium sp.]|uniref:hypothetical protein n=1 Tax=Roseibium sp. TaxID=1936156 RepID=UPI003D9C57F2
MRRKPLGEAGPHLGFGVCDNVHAKRDAVMDFTVAGGRNPVEARKNQVTYAKMTTIRAADVVCMRIEIHKLI